MVDNTVIVCVPNQRCEVGGVEVQEMTLTLMKTPIDALPIDLCPEFVSVTVRILRDPKA